MVFCLQTPFRFVVLPVLLRSLPLIKGNRRYHPPQTTTFVAEPLDKGVAR